MPKTRWMRLLALLLGLSLVAAACGDDDSSDSSDTTEPSDTTETTAGEMVEGGTVVFASDQEPDGWNINTSSSNLLALGQLTEVVFPAAFRTLPSFDVVVDDALLESAELVSEDPQVIEYVIDADAVWSDGTPISADDFAYMWRMQNGTNPDVDAASTTGYERIESVEGSEDGKTVTVTYSEPYAEWNSLFTNILPVHIMTELGDGDEVAGWNDGLDGEAYPEFSGGPFMFTDYQPEQSVTLVPNENFWGEQPHLDEIVVRFDVDNASLAAAFENDEIDVAYPQPQLDLQDQVDSMDDVDYVSSIGLQFEHIDFNLANVHLAKPEVRMAIAHALDEEDVVTRTVGQFNPDATILQNRIWLSNQPQYEAHGLEYEGANIDEATALLEEAGYDCSGDVCEHPDDGPLSLRISTTGGNQLREDTEVVLQSQLAEAGIEIVIDNTEGGAVFSRFFPDSNLLADQDFDIALFAWVGTPFPSSNKALYTNEDPETVGSNETGYQNPDLVGLFDEALVETDPDTLVDLYNQIDELIWGDVPTVPLYQKPTFLIFRTNISGIEDNASTAGPLWNAYEWSLAA